MKILQINVVYPEGSTGRIAEGIYAKCLENDMECKIAYRYQLGKAPLRDTLSVSSWLDCHVHNRLARMTMLQGCFSYFKTLSFLRKVKKYDPDIIHLHNIHGSYIHQGLLFRYIKNHHIRVVWTLHDCWAFTGGCVHFSYEKCVKWEKGCHKCEKMRQKKHVYMDNSKTMWKLKKKWFTGVDYMTLITPSQWLAELTSRSFLKDYPRVVINNGIDLSVFKPTESQMREKLNVSKKNIILGVAFCWNYSKGIDVFIELAQRLDNQKYQIILVGTNESIDKILPDNMISIRRTDNQKELAELYSIADVFVNPTRAEMFGLTNVEALACGTPVITFRTGGSPECIDELCGSVVECDDIDTMEKEIIRICQTKPYLSTACVNRAKAFDRDDKFKEYIALYKNIIIPEKQPQVK